MIQSQDKSSKDVTLSEQVVFKRTGSHLWIVLRIRLAQFSRNEGGSRVHNDEEGRREREYSSIQKTERLNGLRLCSFSEKS